MCETFAHPPTSRTEPVRDVVVPPTIRHMTDASVHNIADPLLSLATPIENLTELPGNPRRGAVKDIARSLRVFGQRKPVTARQTGTDEHGNPVGYVTAGNHTLIGARDELAWTHLAVAWFDEDETTGNAWAVADNHLSDMGTNDNDALAVMLEQIVAADHDLFAATAYTDEALENLLRSGLPPPGDAPAVELPGQWGVIVECDTEAEQVALITRLTADGHRVRATM